MKFETTRFGQIDVKAEDIIIFPDGPLGFPECTRFTLVTDERSHPFKMLQSLDKSALAFVIIDPLITRTDYHFNVTKDDLKNIKATTTDGLEVYAIVTMSDKMEEVTVNLQGPLVINTITRLGHQFVLVNEGYSTTEKLLQESHVHELQKESTVASEEDKQKKAM